MPKIFSEVSRRRFLRDLALGASASVLASPSMADTLTNTGRATSAVDDSPFTKDDLLTSAITNSTSMQTVVSSTSCKTPNIETRLFASSNVGGSDERNELGLERLVCAGFRVDNPDIVSRQYLRFAGTDAQRASDLQNIATGAIVAPKLLIGVRGGYGAVRVLPMIDWETLGRVMSARGTILVGFSDVTAIQCALLAKGGMSSLAGPMLYSEFGKIAPDQVSCRQFAEALSNPNLSIDITSAALTSDNLPTILATNDSQILTGIVWGGNLSVVSSLAGSKYLPRIDGGIVFLEDVGEQPYRIERMLYDLYLAGVFKDQQAIIFGPLSSAGEDSYDKRYDVATVIRQLHKLTGLPIYSGMTFGHIAKKHSFPLGAKCEIRPNDTGGYQLSFSDYPTIQADAIHVEGLWQ